MRNGPTWKPCCPAMAPRADGDRPRRLSRRLPQGPARRLAAVAQPAGRDRHARPRHERRRRPDRDDVYSTASPTRSSSAPPSPCSATKTPNAELFLNGRWYPVTLNVAVPQRQPRGNHLSKGVLVHGTLSLCETALRLQPLRLPGPVPRRRRACPRTHRAPGAQPLRLPRRAGPAGRVQPEAAPRRAAAPRARQASCSSAARSSTDREPLVVPARSRRRLGTPEMPRKCVVEAGAGGRRGAAQLLRPLRPDQEGMSRLPFVRVFSLDTKGYVYADVDDVRPTSSTRRRWRGSTCRAEMLGVLTRVFNDAGRRAVRRRDPAASTAAS